MHLITRAECIVHQLGQVSSSTGDGVPPSPWSARPTLDSPKGASACPDIGAILRPPRCEWNAVIWHCPFDKVSLNVKPEALHTGWAGVVCSLGVQ